MLILRNYQNDCVNAVRESFAKGNKKILCTLATGAGKTAIAGSIIKQYLKKNPTKRVIFLSHLSILVDQTGQSLLDHWDIKSDILQAQDIPNAKSRCIISTIQSFKNEEKVQEWANKLGYGNKTIDNLNIGLVFYDEVHYAFKSNTHKAIDAILPNVYQIGLSATPIKNNQLITDHFDDVAFKLSTQELIDMGFLVPPRLKVLDVNPLNQDELYTSLVTTYKLNHNGKKAIIFLKTIDDCMDLASIFIESNVKAMAITSKVSGDVRAKDLDSFRSNAKGSINVLITVNVLTAGFDSPNVEVIFMPYKISSIVNYIQRVGRGLRICPEINKTECIVYAASKTPKLDAKKWEQMNTKLLGSNSSKKADNYIDEIELSMLSEIKLKWTKDVVRVCKEIERKGMTNLASKIINKDFPEDLLNVLKDLPVYKPTKISNAKATLKQRSVLRKYEIDSNVTKQEASVLINAIAAKENWDIPEWKKVKTGKYKGRNWDNISYMYIKSLPWGNETRLEWNVYRAMKKSKVKAYGK